jgi:hypothetical protein
MKAKHKAVAILLTLAPTLGLASQDYAMDNCQSQMDFYYIALNHRLDGKSEDYVLKKARSAFSGITQKAAIVVIRATYNLPLYRIDNKEERKEILDNLYKECLKVNQQ